jgi:hypothetical protein
MQPQESSLPGTTKDKLAPLLHATHWRQEMTHKDPNVRLERSWALEAVDSNKRDSLVRPRKRKARSKPSLVIGEGHASLTKQKQQANQRPNAGYVSCKTTI